MNFMGRVLMFENGTEVGRNVDVFATLAWVVLPYPAIVLLTVDLIWRYKTDQHGWTSRSSNWNELAILRWSSPMFHSGILSVGLGHVDDLLAPEAVTEALGVSEEMHHMGATMDGGIAGLVIVIGLLGLFYRRTFVKSVCLATIRMNIVTYVLLRLPIALGTIATVMYQVLPSLSGHGYDRRETISVWFRSILMTPPKPEYMLDAPLIFQMRIIAGMFLFCVWPLTCFVHVASVPLGYVTRPSVVYRLRDAKQPVGRKHGWRTIHPDDYFSFLAFTEPLPPPFEASRLVSAPGRGADKEGESSLLQLSPAPWRWQTETRFVRPWSKRLHDAYHYPITC